MTPPRTKQIQGVSFQPRGETQVMRPAVRVSQGLCLKRVCSHRHVQSWKIASSSLVHSALGKDIQEET